MKRLILFLVSSFCIVAYSQNRHDIYYPKYDFKFSSVENLNKEQYSIAKIDSGYFYSDNNFEIEIYASSDRYFDFKIKNKSGTTLKIIWDNAAYVNYDNVSSNIIHTGIKFSEINAHQIPSVIVKNSIVEEEIAPINCIEYTDDGWSVIPILKRDTFNSLEEIQKNKDEIEGKHVQLLLPIQKNDSIIEYLFDFEITNYQIHKNSLFICGDEVFKPDEILNQKLVYDEGNHYFYIGNLKFSRKDRTVDCILELTENIESLDVLTNIRKKINLTNNLIGMEGAVFISGGIIVLASYGDKNIQIIGACISAVAACILIPSIIIRIRAVEDFKKVADLYVPYKGYLSYKPEKCLKFGLAQSGLGLTLSF